MPLAHRNGDARNCGASTVVTGQSSVLVNGRLWAVNGDPNSHGMGNLIASGNSVLVEGIRVIVHAPDNANPDSLCPLIGDPHCNPRTASASDDVNAY